MLIGIGELLSTSFQTTKKGFVEGLKYLFAAFGVFLVPVFVAALIMGSSFLGLKSGSAAALGGIGFFGFLLYYVSIIGAVYFSTWMGLGFIKMIAAKATGGATVSFKEALWPIDHHLVLKSLAVYILYMYAVMMGYMLLIIPGILLTIWLMFGYFAVVLGGKDPYAALVSSKSLAKGRWWALFGRLFVIGLVNLLIFMALAFVLGFPVKGLIASSPMAGFILFGIVYVVVGVVMSLLVTAQLVILYQSLVSAGPKVKEVAPQQ